MLRHGFRLVVYAILALSYATGAHAGTRRSATLADLTASAARVFRGRCVAAEVGMAEVAGAHIPATTYTFRVSDHLKGAPSHTITFRQVGTPEGGLHDLGRLAGLPVYVPGTEYVLFLLPDHRAGLTSPAGSAQGAFVVSGEQVRGIQPGTRLLGERPAADRLAQDQAAPPDAETMPYEALRRAVLDLVGR